jgi:hypothetical protein
LARRGGGDAAVFQATVVDQPHGSLIVRGRWSAQRLAVAHAADVRNGDSITGPASKMSM